MFEVLNLKGRTYFFEAYSNVGIYEKENGEAILIDSCDHKRMVRSVNRYLTEKNLRVSTIISTHCLFSQYLGISARTPFTAAPSHISISESN